MKKNTATKIVFPILDADGDPVTSAAGLDSEYSLDGGAFADCANEATEISGGIYYLNLAAGETNGDVVAIQVKTSTSGAKTTVLVFYTATQTLDETDVICDAIKAKTDALPDSVWSVATRALTDKTGFSLAADQSAVTVGTVTTLTNWDKTGYALSAAAIDAILDETLAGHSTADSAGLALKNLLKIGKNKWDISGTTFTIYDDNGISVLYQFTLDSGTEPTSRTPL